jgi:fluoroquinolone transport system permease protein
LRKKGYLLVRMITPVLLTWIFTLLMTKFTNLIHIDMTKGLSASLLWTMEAPMMALFLAAFASNKVEGLALTKGAGILVATPIAVQFLPWPWDALIMISPTYWPAKVLFAKDTLAWFALGSLIHGGILWMLYRSFQKRVE